MAFTNKYPFYVNMPTSSKQSRKVSMLANAIRAENTFVAALRQEQSLVNEWKKRKEREEAAGRGEPSRTIQTQSEETTTTMVTRTGDKEQQQQVKGPKRKNTRDRVQKPRSEHLDLETKNW